MVKKQVDSILPKSHFETDILQFFAGRSLTEKKKGGGERKKKKVFRNQFSQKSLRALHVLNRGWWRLAVGGWRRLAVGSWQLATGGWWRLVAVGGGWRWLVAVGGWRLVAVGG